MMSQRLKFDYEIVLSSNWQKSGYVTPTYIIIINFPFHELKELFIINFFRYEYGKKLPDGSWSGLVGDLTSGNIDLVVADMTMVRIMCFLFCLNSLRFFL